jgi:hypothetical protein
LFTCVYPSPFFHYIHVPLLIKNYWSFSHCKLISINQLPDMFSESYNHNYLASRRVQCLMTLNKFRLPSLHWRFSVPHLPIPLQSLRPLCNNLQPSWFFHSVYAALSNPSDIVICLNIDNGQTHLCFAATIRMFSVF